jgi:hypothetical protein|tara:strand:+ start:1337 stop:1513 length:177 start_codon:yes stop_codon:yes gene_type:complete
MRAPYILDDDEEDEVKLLDSFRRHTATTEFNLLLIVADMMTTSTRETDTTFICTGFGA